MIEIEIYAAGIRSLDKILALDHALEAFPELRYKVDSNHDIVYFEADAPCFSLKDVCGAFERLSLVPKVVGIVPEALQKNSGKKTQQIS